jgi:hypothetical protein
VLDRIHVSRGNQGFEVGMRTGIGSGDVFDPVVGEFRVFEAYATAK